MKGYYWAGLVFIYLIPIFIYMSIFGAGVWSSHEDWSNMGSALGGIYSPIIAFTTLLLLYRQQKFNEKSNEQKTKSEFIHRAYTKCESYVSLAGAQCSKLDTADLTRFIELLELHTKKEAEDDKYSVLSVLNAEFRPQLTSLTRAGTTIHHMRNSEVDLTGQVSDLRVYAASLIDIELLLAHDSFHRDFVGDTSYYSFDPSPIELERIEKGIKSLRGS